MDDLEVRISAPKCEYMDSDLDSNLKVMFTLNKIQPDMFYFKKTARSSVKHCVNVKWNGSVNPFCPLSTVRHH